jgi:CHAT domain-containing protein
MPADVDDGDPQSLAAAIEARERRLAELSDRLATRRIGQRRGQLENPAAPLSLPTLDPGALVVEFYLRDGDGVAFVIGNGAVQSVPLATNDATVRRLLQLWQLSLDATVHALASGAPLSRPAANTRSLLTALYTALITPLELHLSRCQHLAIIPHGALHAVPFQALLGEAGYLVQRFDVTVCPSLRLLDLLHARPRRTGRAVVLGHSAGGRLPGAVAEAGAVARLLNGELLLEEEATCAGLMARCTDLAILHLAAHGEARLDNPPFAHIALEDEHLTTGEVANLDLEGALIVLSACESGRGLVAAGDDVVSLSRGFLLAGASAMVQSLWQVDDAATSRLFTHFYQALAQGASPASALRQAQMVLLEDQDLHSMPFYWGAFQVVGAPASRRLATPVSATMTAKQRREQVKLQRVTPSRTTRRRQR